MANDSTLFDEIEPRITVPSTITREATISDGARITYSVIAQDNVDGTVTLEEDENSISVSQDDIGSDITISCAPSSGSLFPVGDTTVVCDAVDASGNKGTASFTMRVNAPPGNNGGVGPSNAGDNNLQAPFDRVTETLPEPVADIFPLIL